MLGRCIVPILGTGDVRFFLWGHLLQRGAVDWGKPMCHRQLLATVRLGARSIFSLAPRNLGVANGHVACRGRARDHISKRGARRPAWPGISTFCRRVSHIRFDDL
jgi:hypothetical protein